MKKQNTSLPFFNEYYHFIKHILCLRFGLWVKIMFVCKSLAAVGCGGHFTSQKGEFQSPNWPNEYPSQAVCTWTIYIPSATGIQIVLTHFELQAVSLLGQCVDYVEVFDAAGTTQGLNIYHSIVNK